MSASTDDQDDPSAARIRELELQNARLDGKNEAMQEMLRAQIEANARVGAGAESGAGAASGAGRGVARGAVQKRGASGARDAGKVGVKKKDAVGAKDIDSSAAALKPTKIKINDITTVDYLDQILKKDTGYQCMDIPVQKINVVLFGDEDKENLKGRLMCNDSLAQGYVLEDIENMYQGKLRFIGRKVNEDGTTDDTGLYEIANRTTIHVSAVRYDIKQLIAIEPEPEDEPEPEPEDEPEPETKPVQDAPAPTPRLLRSQNETTPAGKKRRR